MQKLITKMANLVIRKITPAQEAPLQVQPMSPLSSEECYWRLNLSRLQAIEGL